MLDIKTEVNRGIMFIRLEGDLNNSTIDELHNKINYLLYKQGMHYFVINLNETKINDRNIISILQSMFTEIFLSCGKVALCGVKDLKSFGKTKDKLFYINREYDAFKYITI